MEFQVVIPVLISFAISVVLGPVIIPFLRRLKMGQTERTEGVQSLSLIHISQTSFWQSADIACPGILLGQAIGRWGNFFNRESFGEYTDLPWAMQIPVSAVRSGEVLGAMRDNLLTINGISYIQVQPVFLYESLWCLLLFLLLMAMRRKKKYEGELFMIYLAGYGLGRFFFEWFRTDKL